MTEKGITATQEFGKLIKQYPPDAHDHFLRMLEARTEQLRWYYGQGEPAEFVKAFYEAFDEGMAKALEGEVVSCKKGCHLCCRQNVEISEAEAAAIVEYCREQDIAIPKDRLKEQLKYGRKEVARTDVGWCIFLVCGIYPVRPLACRKHYVASPPEQCDTVNFQYPNNKVAMAVFGVPELEVSAFYGVMKEKGKSGRLPEMLLPYSK